MNKNIVVSFVITLLVLLALFFYFRIEIGKFLLGNQYQDTKISNVAEIEQKVSTIKTEESSQSVQNTEMPIDDTLVNEEEEDIESQPDVVDAQAFIAANKINLEVSKTFDIPSDRKALVLNEFCQTTLSSEESETLINNLIARNKINSDGLTQLFSREEINESIISEIVGRNVSKEEICTG